MENDGSDKRDGIMQRNRRLKQKIEQRKAGLLFRD